MAWSPSKFVLRALVGFFGIGGARSFGLPVPPSTTHHLGVWRFADTSVPSPFFTVDENNITLETRASAVQCSYRLVNKDEAACWGFRVVRHNGAINLEHARAFYNIVRRSATLRFRVDGDRANVAWDAPRLHGSADFVRALPEPEFCRDNGAPVPL